MLHGGLMVIWLLSALAICATAACGTEETETPPRRVAVVATFSVIGDLAQRVGGDMIELSVLVNPSSDVHKFRPVPADAVALAEANVVFSNGAELESAWFPELFEAVGSSAEHVVLTNSTPLLYFNRSDPDHPGASVAGAGNIPDPHAWHDVTLAIRIVEDICGALIKADPPNSAVYRANADSFLAELSRLHAWVQERVATLPVGRRKLVMDHADLGYFAHRYGFKVVGTALGASTEESGASAADIAGLVRLIRREGVQAVFADVNAHAQLMRRVSMEAGVPMYKLFTTLGESGTGADTYVEMMRSNVRTIVRALGE